jgi:hypothetical protein
MASTTTNPQHLGPFRTGRAAGEGSELVRHGDEDPVHVPRGRETRHDGVEVIGRHLHRHAHAVVAALPEGTGEAHRGLDVPDGVTNDREQPRSATEKVGHVNRLAFRIV